MQQELIGNERGVETVGTTNEERNESTASLTFTAGAVSPEMKSGDRKQGERTDSSSDTERSALEACLNCGVDMIQRRTDARFCLNRCRTQYGRHQKRLRICELVTKIEQLFLTLKKEIDRGEA
jgi:hypothetical protein